MSLDSRELTNEVSDRLEALPSLHQIVKQVLAVLVERGFIAYDVVPTGMTAEQFAAALAGCPGGSRRSFTEWPPEAIEAATDTFMEKALNGGLIRRADGALMPDWEEAMKAALAAAWGHITGDNK